LANLALTLTGDVEELFDQFESFPLRVRLKEGEAADHFFGFGERAVGHGDLAAGEANARAFRAGQAALDGQEGCSTSRAPKREAPRAEERR
jgi:hypothetical protein